MPHKSDCLIIAIAGASASGKSLIANTIFKELKADLGAEKIAIISEDSYYKDQSDIPMDERIKTNYDHPNSLDHQLLISHLKSLINGKAVDIPQYCYNTHNRLPETTHIAPKKIIILEGILLLSSPKLRDQLHASIFMDTPLDICLLRRLKRDVAERGRTMESVLKQYQETVRPMYIQFIEPSKQHADLIVPRGGKNRIAIDMLKAKIRQLLN
ncbi:uridine kinase [Psychromonas sp. MME1]|uniref:uridine kinase n=1 Tax=Psychromonas sp. MME1 TaxID=3231032 RepID=UPI0034E285BD